jgi:hypothetical protein
MEGASTNISDVEYRLTTAGLLERALIIAAFDKDRDFRDPAPNGFQTQVNGVLVAMPSGAQDRQTTPTGTSFLRGRCHRGQGDHGERKRQQRAHLERTRQPDRKVLTRTATVDV